MGRMSEINQDLKDINNWFKNHVCYILVGFVIAIVAILVHGEEAKKINNIENRLTRQENYMHEVKADIDNLYEVINL